MIWYQTDRQRVESAKSTNSRLLSTAIDATRSQVSMSCHLILSHTRCILFSKVCHGPRSSAAVVASASLCTTPSARAITMARYAVRDTSEKYLVDMDRYSIPALYCTVLHFVQYFTVLYCSVMLCSVVL